MYVLNNKTSRKWFNLFCSSWKFFDLRLIWSKSRPFDFLLAFPCVAVQRKFVHFNQQSHAVLSMVEIIGTKCCRMLEGNQMVSTLGFDAICHKSNVWYAVQKHCWRLPPSISSFDHWCLFRDCHSYNDCTCTGRQSWKTQIFWRRSCRNQTMIFENLFILFHQLYNKSLPLTPFDTQKKLAQKFFLNQFLGVSSSSQGSQRSLILLTETVFSCLIGVKSFP